MRQAQLRGLKASVGKMVDFVLIADQYEQLQ